MKGKKSGLVAHIRDELSGQRCTAKRAWLDHRKMCHPCRPAQDDSRFWCADGYELARTLHLAHRALVEYDAKQAADQLGLFGPEEGTEDDRTIAP